MRKEKATTLGERGRSLDRPSVEPVLRELAACSLQHLTDRLLDQGKVNE